MTKNLLDQPPRPAQPRAPAGPQPHRRGLRPRGQRLPGEIGLGAMELVAAMYRSAPEGRVVDPAVGLASLSPSSLGAGGGPAARKARWAWAIMARVTCRYQAVCLRTGAI
ncbi:hypothetical protein [Actinomadura madurae]|uniref:hypothetical protein n=1 Tax=Actinomadura madurae TaxID=1993 RepID=UPI0020D23F7A|nr:hypothetical protein [Actinomadura madurae]MCP9951453.1 hypothetical protein [Actinomadura madurae]MCP9968228.1 hypothetical protein [Actinomadura madurae]MCP9980686.1 hypothetical protein [Actinomadura madurae]MCQ0007805.1 hypothetical protein [Actinomadura madurae]MCQ0016885.1 hypothetical protein [Actinomadura madurae]